MTRRHRSAEELAPPMAAGDDDAAFQECRAVVRKFIGELYWTFRVGAESSVTSVTSGVVRKYMDLLQQKGVATVTKGSPQTVELTPAYQRLYEAPLLSTPAGC